MRRRHVLIVVLAAVVAALAVVSAVGLAARLDPGGFEVRGGAVEAATQTLAERFAVGEADLVAVVRVEGHAVDDPAFVRALDRIDADVRSRAEVEALMTPRDPGGAALVSADRTAAVVTVTLAGTALEQQEAASAVIAALHVPQAEVIVGGAVAAQVEGQRIAEHDLVRGELITLPLVAALLWIFFRGPIAALLPVGVGALAIGMAAMVLRGLSMWMTVSVFALNVVTFVGLGLSIDYSLFLVQRFREELAAGADVETARRATLHTAGKTIAYSGAAVAASLLSLAWIPIPLLRSIAIGGSLVVGMTLVAALVVLPAGLALLGRRLEPRRARVRPSTRGAWARLAHGVMRRPALIALVLLGVLLTLGAPALRMQVAVTDARSFPAGSEVHRVQGVLEADFPHLGATTIDALVQLPGDAPEAKLAQLEALEAELAALPDVLEVVGPAAALARSGLPPDAPAAMRAQARAGIASTFIDEDRGRLRVVSSAEPGTPEADALVEAVEALGSSPGMIVATGPAAAARETHAAILERLPWAVVSVMLTTFVVLLLGFGAVTVALKAIAMNVLSLSASFGALVWIFQDGRLEGILDYRSPGSIDPLIPLLVFAIVFGLSMDYELFLLSRIREDFAETGDPRGSVARGLQATAGLITSAALMLLVVMAAFASSELLFLRELGVSMVIAVVVDATLVRALLVPSTMALLGRLNWWAPPRFVAWWTRHRLGVHEGIAGESIAGEAPPTDPGPSSTQPGER